MISANPTTFTEGGSLIDDVDAKILEAGTHIFDYNGKPGMPEVPAIRVVYGLGADFSEIHIEEYSAGDLKKFVPSGGDEAFQSPYGTPKDVESIEIGMGFVAVGDAQFLNKNSKAGMLLASLANAGLDPATLDSGNFYQALTGLVVHLARQVMPERTGGKALNAETQQKKKFPDTVLLISEIKGEAQEPAGKALAAHSKVGAKDHTNAIKAGAAKPAAAAKAPAAAKPAAAPAAAPAPAPVAVAGGDLDEQLQGLLLGKLTAGEGVVIKKKDLVPIAWGGLPAASRSAGSQRIVQAEFLSNGPWTFANDQISIGG